MQQLNELEEEIGEAILALNIEKKSKYLLVMKNTVFF